MKSTLSILLGAVLIAASILFVFRYDVSTTADGTVRLDSWTGAVTRCLPAHTDWTSHDLPAPLDCKPRTEAELAKAKQAAAAASAKAEEERKAEQAAIDACLKQKGKSRIDAGAVSDCEWETALARAQAARAQ